MELIKRTLLPLNLQYFAEPGDEDLGGENPGGQGDGGTGEGAQGGADTGGEPGKKDDPKTFTQAELDAIISDRLARAKKKQDDAEQAIKDAAEKKRLEEQGDFKALADARQLEVDRLQALIDSQTADVLQAKKESLLSKAGYKDDQIEVFVGLVTGETDDELKASLDRIKAVSPPAKGYADPGTGNGRKDEPKKKDLHEKGKTAYQRLKEKGKIRGRK